MQVHKAFEIKGRINVEYKIPEKNKLLAKKGSLAEKQGNNGTILETAASQLTSDRPKG